MGDAREQPKHARGVLGVGRLAEDFALDDDHGIRAQHEALRRRGSGDLEGLLARRAKRKLFAGLARVALFCDRARSHHEIEPGRAQ